MSKTIQEIKYRAKTVDEILEKIAIDRKRFKAKEQIVEKRIQRNLPLFWQKDYIYSVQFKTDVHPSEKGARKQSQKETDKEMILRMLEEDDDSTMASELKVVVDKPVAPKLSTTSLKDTMISDYRMRLLDAEVRADIVDTLLARTRKELMDVDYEQVERVEEELLEQMTNMMHVSEPVALEDMKKIVLIGPTGVGKTTTIGKMAGILVSKGKRIGFITTDVYRIGATHQLDIYAKIVNSTMVAADSPKELEEAIHYFENVEKVDHILIDTVGRSPMDAGNVEDMKAYLEIANPDHICLVLSCTQKEKDVYKILENFQTAGVNSVIFTKLDETLQHGILLNVMADKKACVSFIANGQDVPQDLYVATPKELANKILRGVDEFERPSI